MKNLSKFSAPLPHCGEKKKRGQKMHNTGVVFYEHLEGKGVSQGNWAWLGRKTLGGLAGLLETEARHSKQQSVT